MRVPVRRVMGTSALLLVSAFAAHAGEMFTPALPASPTQFQECRIVNVTNTAQSVTSQAFMSTGAPSSGVVSQTLAPGEAGGFSIAGTAASVYCKFTFKGSASGFRTSIDVLDSNAATGTWAIVVALPGS